MKAVGRDGFRRPAVPMIDRVPLPEAGEGACAAIRKLPARDLIELRQLQGRNGETDNMAFVYELLVRTLCDDAGEPIYDSAAQMREEFNLSVACLTRLADEALRYSGIEGKEKNSPPNSATSSP